MHLDIRTELLEAYQSDSALKLIGDIYVRSARKENYILPDVLVELNTTIDIFSLFSGATAKSNEYNFWAVCQVFVDVLPKIQVAPSKLLECLNNLLVEAGSNAGLNGVFSALEKYCEQRPEYPKDLLLLIIQEPECSHNFLNNVLVSGGKQDPKWFIDNLIVLTTHSQSTVRAQCVMAIERANFLSGEWQSTIWDMLSTLVDKENDEVVKGRLLRACLKVGNKIFTDSSATLKLLATLLKNNEPEVLFQASNLARIEPNANSQEIFELFINHLQQCTPDCQPVLDQIDYILVDLLEANQVTIIDQLLTSLLSEPQSNSINAFDYFTSELLTKYRLYRDHTIVSWLSSRNTKLCRAAEDILESVVGDEAKIEINLPNKEVDYEVQELIFLAKKGAGWLFARPVSAASLLLSIYLKLPTSSQSQIIKLIFDPLLLSYPGELGRYLKEKSSVDEYSEVCLKLIQMYEEYSTNLQHARECKELNAPQNNTVAYWNEFNNSMQKAKDEAPKSIFEQLCTVQHLLYGNSSAFYVSDETGEHHRSEVQMQSISHSVEMPKLPILAPEGFELELRFLRTEGHTQ